VSNSPRAKARRGKRGRATKHQRTTMSSQHFGAIMGAKKSEKKTAEALPDTMSALQQKMEEMRGRL